MRITDLGVLSGPVLLFGGPYSNLQATKALIARANALGIAPDHCICTGDVVAYCADAAASVEAIRDFGCPVVAGNMELSLGAGQTDCGCGFEEGTACDLMSGAWFAHASAQMRDADRVWMAQLPDWIMFTHAGKRTVVLHGGAQDVARFFWPNTPDAEFANDWAVIEAACGPIDRVVSGHSGIPFERDFDFGTWINAGVIGMPPHDGGTATRFAVLDGETLQIQELAYDHRGAAHAMQAAGLTQGYHDGLTTGYWPSEDILPSELRVSSRASG